MDRVLGFIKHRIVGVSFISFLLLVAVVLIIIYKEDTTRSDKYITAGIVGVLWLVSSYDYLSLSIRQKSKTRRDIQSAQTAGLQVSSKIITGIHHNRAKTDGMDSEADTELEDAIVVATVAGVMAEATSIVEGATVEEAIESKEAAIEQAIDNSNVSYQGKQMLREVVRPAFLSAISDPQRRQLKPVETVQRSNGRAITPRLLQQVRLKTVEKASYEIVKSMNKTNPVAANKMKASLADQIKNAKLKTTGVNITSPEAFARSPLTRKVESMGQSQVNDAISRFNNRASAYGNDEDYEEKPESSAADWD